MAVEAVKHRRHGLNRRETFPHSVSNLFCWSAFVFPQLSRFRARSATLSSGSGFGLMLDRSRVRVPPRGFDRAAGYERKISVPPPAPGAYAATREWLAANGERSEAVLSGMFQVRRKRVNTELKQRISPGIHHSHQSEAEVSRCTTSGKRVEEWPLTSATRWSWAWPAPL